MSKKVLKVNVDMEVYERATEINFESAGFKKDTVLVSVEFEDLKVEIKVLENAIITKNGKKLSLKEVNNLIDDLRDNDTDLNDDDALKERGLKFEEVNYFEICSLDRGTGCCPMCPSASSTSSTDDWSLNDSEPLDNEIDSVGELVGLCIDYYQLLD